MDSFVTITLKSALLEITDAKNQYSSIPKYFLYKRKYIEQNFFNCLPVQSFVEDTLKSLSTSLVKFSLQSCRHVLRCNL